MLSWLSSPRSPLNLYDKTWIEWRLAWIAEQLQWNTMLKSETWSPTKHHQVIRERLSPDDAQSFVELVTSLLPNNERECRLIILPDHEMPEGTLTPGDRPSHYYFDATTDPESGVTSIRLAESELNDASMTLGLLTLEAIRGYAINYLPQLWRKSDTDWIIGLLPVFFGFGAIVANSTLRYSSDSDGVAHYSSMKVNGPLSAQMYGYAIGLRCWLMNEDPSPWSSLLRPDAQGSLKATLGYLKKTGDSIVTPGHLAKPTPASWGSGIEHLRSDSNSIRLVALWELIEAGTGNEPTLIDAVSESLEHPEPAIRQAAMDVICTASTKPPQTLDTLRNLLLDYKSDFAFAAAQILAEHGAHLDEVQYTIEKFFRHNMHRKGVELLQTLVLKQGLDESIESLLPGFLFSASTLLRGEENEQLFWLLQPVLSQITDLAEVISADCSAIDPQTVDYLMQISLGIDPFPYRPDS